MFYNQFPPYVSVAKRREKAEKKIKNLRKKNHDIQPVVIEGRSIATTWWGKSWNKNLESYADYSNRIVRGRSYVRHSGVVDLKINEGVVEALVAGSMTYKVTINIAPMNNANWESIKNLCKGKFDSLQELLSGKFPKSLAEIFTDKEKGLFPSPSEIKFSCTCPDWAYMCKHVAATLYGVGARLDLKPELFFTLRSCSVEDLLTQAVQEHAVNLIEKAEKKNARVIEESDLSDVFGIDLDMELETKTKVNPKSKTKPKIKEKGKLKAKTKEKMPKGLQKKQKKKVIKKKATKRSKAKK